MHPPQQLIAGRYRLDSVLGAGSSGVVHAARDLRLDRAVAVKLVAATQIGPHDLGGRQRFVREARAAARFSHPHTVAVHDAGEDAGQLYLVMELVDGPTLAGALLATGPFAIDDAVRIADQMLAGLDAAHRAGIVHRDVKPANVLLTPAGQVKLADFGIARRLDDGSSTLTGEGLLVGTLRYLAPEQLLGATATPASDVYSVGVVLYEILTGRPPIDAPSAVALVAAHRAATELDPRRERAEIPPDVAAVVVRALQPDPAQRYPTAIAMRSALAGVLDRPPREPAGVDPAAVATTALDVSGRCPADLDATALVALAATEMLPRPRPAGPHGTVAAAVPIVPDRRRATPGRRRRASVVSAMFGGVVLVIIACVAVLATRDGSTSATSTTSPAAAPVPATERSITTDVPAASPSAPAAITTAAPTTTAAPSITTPEPTDLRGLIDLVAADPARFGAHADEVARRLHDVTTRKGRKQSDEAARLLREVADWTDAGELDDAVAGQIIAILGPIAGRHG